MKNIFKTSLMALAGIMMFSACDDDRDSNPVLNTSGNVTFQLNVPEVGTGLVDLGLSTAVTLTWSQPELATDNAPLGLAGVYGLRYAVQLSKDGNFTKSFEDALAALDKDEAGNYIGKPVCDYTTLPTTFSACVSEVPASELNRGLNEVFVYEEDNLPASQSVFVRVVAQLARTNGQIQQLAASNTQQLNLVPSSWVDVTEVPLEAAYLWVPGNGNGWSHDVAPILVAEDGVTFKGYAYMDGDFKFTLAADWSDEYNNGTFTSTTENIDCGDGGGGNISYIGEPSMCWIECTPSTGELLVTPVTWSIIGGFNSWGGDEFLVYDKGAHCMSLTYTFDSDTEWKFRRDSDWAINFGGTFDALEQDGPNFNATAGEHTIRLYLERPSVDGMYAEME